ncbi:hypothetical protein PI124_g18331 [Phytophthora idaei]|nr:hypothetical protein PI125_g799 [Phytophthora idaei]KAG3136721.1 hypothetical protein PI126_g17695 [Phytophthora idaei]KAG3236666.1 hypothetical protein PI124_g18331 [Phytophthora idaei]
MIVEAEYKVPDEHELMGTRSKKKYPEKRPLGKLAKQLSLPTRRSQKRPQKQQYYLSSSTAGIKRSISTSLLPVEGDESTV